MIYNKICVICNNNFQSKSNRAMYCSYECKVEGMKRRNKNKTLQKYGNGKICPKCGNKFIPNKNGWTRQYCFDCVPPESYSSGARLRQRIKQWALEYKGGKCCICGYNKCTAALDFHHRDMAQKDFNLSNRNIKLDWESIKTELDKCDLVCANCHREIHAMKEGSDEQYVPQT